MSVARPVKAVEAKFTISSECIACGAPYGQHSDMNVQATGIARQFRNAAFAGIAVFVENPQEMVLQTGCLFHSLDAELSDETHEAPGGR